MTTRCLMKLRWFLLTCLLSFALPSCAAIVPLIPKIAAVVTDAIATIQVIDSAVDTWMDQHPNVDPKVRARYEAAYAKCVQALNAANHALAGAEQIDQEDFDAAFANFKVAYLELRNLLVMEGIARPGVDGELSVSAVAASDAIVLPEPEALTYRLAP